jgi:hypothetical protein
MTDRDEDQEVQLNAENLFMDLQRKILQLWSRQAKETHDKFSKLKDS